MNLPDQKPISRRTLAVGSAFGIGQLALGRLLAGEGRGSDPPPHHSPTATSVIVLFMSGGPSQVDTFDPKPNSTVSRARMCPNQSPRTFHRSSEPGSRT